MKCKSCGKQTVRIDCPIESFNERYHIEDTEWSIVPSNEDPGLLVAKPGTIPISQGCEK